VATLRSLTALIEREGEGYVAIYPEYDIASQGDTVEEARVNLTEALTLFFETADASELSRRSQREVFITQVEVPVG
jgi:predicted RNase H-like HicB family nuclease